MVVLHLAHGNSFVTLVKQLHNDGSTIRIATDIQGECSILVERLHLDALLERLARLAIDIDKCSTVYLETIL